MNIGVRPVGRWVSEEGSERSHIIHNDNLHNRKRCVCISLLYIVSINCIVSYVIYSYWQNELCLVEEEADKWTEDARERRKFAMMERRRTRLDYCIFDPGMWLGLEIAIFVIKRGLNE